jgi:hypothetical protein
LDKDDGPKDDYIGRFTTNVEPGAKEEEIHGRITKRTKGTFWLKVRKFLLSQSLLSAESSFRLCSPDRKYTLDGPVP